MDLISFNAKTGKNLAKSRKNAKNNPIVPIYTPISIGLG